MSGPKICVIGAGIIGLPTAVCIQQAVPNASVTVIAEKFTPDTTGDGAAGFWMPHLLGDVPQHINRQWCVDTWDHIEQLCHSELEPEVGAMMCSGFMVHNKNEPYPDCRDMWHGFREMTDRELALYPGYKFGWALTTYFLVSRKYLPWMMKRFEQNGGTFEKRKLLSLEEVYPRFDVIVNCPGVGARDLLGDEEVVPVRGQTLRLEAAPWIKHFVIAENGDNGETNFVFPLPEMTVLGNTHEHGNWSTEPDPKERDRIWRVGSKLVPSLKNCKVIGEWVGLRPYRPKVRLEREIKQHKGRRVQIVHNYGHGGSGITIHWGCAKHATRLVKEALNATSSRL